MGWYLQALLKSLVASVDLRPSNLYFNKYQVSPQNQVILPRGQNKCTKGSLKHQALDGIPAESLSASRRSVAINVRHDVRCVTVPTPRRGQITRRPSQPAHTAPDPHKQTVHCVRLTSLMTDDLRTSGRFFHVVQRHLITPVSTPSKPCSIAAFISRSYDWLLAESCRLFDRLSVRLRIVAVGVGVQV